MSKNVIIIAGPNGSGKTTFVTEYLRDSAVEYISADAIAAELVSTPEDMDNVKIQVFCQSQCVRIGEFVPSRSSA